MFTIPKIYLVKSDSFEYSDGSLLSLAEFGFDFNFSLIIVIGAEGAVGCVLFV